MARLFKGLTRGAGMLMLLFTLEAAWGQRSYSNHATISESANKIHLAANDSRPLAQSLDALQQKYGWRVNYEDAQYTSTSDLVDAEGLQDKSSYPNGRHRVPGGGAWNVEFAAGTTPDAQPDPKKTLQLLVNSYNQSGNPGQFELRNDRPEPVFDVVGTAAHDSHGRISKQQVLLDLQITIDSQERTATDTIELICQKVAEKSGIKITFGVHPLGLDRGSVTVGGKDLTGRSLLFRTIESTGRKLCWRLLFDPDSNGYFLNLQQLKVPSSK